MKIEYEHLDKRILQTERLTTIGRLTANLSHEMNNSMQAIQGALSLALEQVDEPSELATFLRLSLEEAEKVGQLLNRLRYAYFSRAEVSATFDLNYFLEEAITLARGELKRQKVTVQANLTPDLPPVIGVTDQLYLVFLSLLLNLGDAIGAADGGELQLRSYTLPQMVGIEFSTDVSIVSTASESHISESDTWQKELIAGLGLSFSYDIIVAHSGTMALSRQNGGIICSVELPCSMSDSPTVI